MSTSLLDPLREALHQPVVLEFLQRLGLVTFRVLPLIVFTPIFGGMQVPARFRFGAALALAVPLTLALPALPAPQPGLNWVFHGLRELFIGAILAFGVAIIFHAVTAAGALVDMLRGDQAAGAFDPLFQRSESALSVWFLQASVAVFLTLGGHREVLTGLAESYRWVQLSGGPMPELAGRSLAVLLIGYLAAFLLIAVQLSAPVMAAVLLVDVAVGLSGRLAARLNVAQLAFGVKGLLAIGVLYLALQGILEAVPRALAERLQALFAIAPGG